MDIEAVKIKKTLKAGEKVWRKGDVVNRPVHPDLVMEVRMQTGTVEVIQREKAAPASPSPITSEPPVKETPLETVAEKPKEEKEEKPSKDAQSEKTTNESKKKLEGSTPKLKRRK